MKTKTIRIKKKGGGTRLQRVQVLASGKYRFMKNPSKSRTTRGGGSRSKSKTKRKNVRRVKNTMAKRRGRRRRSRSSFTLPIAPIAGLAAGMAEPIGKALGGDLEGAIAGLTFNYTGYNVDDGTWDPMRLTRGMVPLIVGALVHKFVGGPPLNINRMLGKAKVPFLRI